jgi:ATP-dependent DNA helicase DinG
VRQQAAGAPDAGIAARGGAVIFDEAHELEEVASSYFGISVSNVRFEDLVRDTEAMLKKGEGYTSVNTAACFEQPAACAIARGCSLRSCRCPWAADGRQPFDNREEFLETRGDLYLSVKAHLIRLEAELDQVRGVDEAPGLRKRVTTCAPSLSSCSNRPPATWSIGWSGACWRAAQAVADRPSARPSCRPRRSMSPACWMTSFF